MPRAGGRTANEGARRAVPVPQRYSGYRGLPRRATPDPDAGADSDGFVALDVNVALPDRRRHPRPRDGYPLIVLLHGCCPGSKKDWRGTIDAGGERWHHNDAWFAARGYVALTYTSRGFVNQAGRGSTGVSELGHRAYEVNDLQYLAGLLAEDPFFGVDPQRIVVSGASFGGAVSWLAITDPSWRSPRKRIPMRLAAAAPKYGWTDLAHALVPNGRYRQGEIAPADPNLALSRNPVGAPKRGLLSGLFSSVPLSPDVADAFSCMTATTPVAANPLCGGVLGVLDSFIRERSAYFQTRFLGGIAHDADMRVPVFSAGSLSDPLAPLGEHRRMADTLRSIVPNYPIREYYGDFGPVLHNKAKEWADLCDRDRHLCRTGDYKRGFNRTPRRFVRFGVATSLNRFIDHYARPPANRRQPRPRRDVTVSLQTCPQNATARWPLDEPGERFNARLFQDLAPNRRQIDFADVRATTATVTPNPHAAEADPVASAGTCASHPVPAGAGVATYDSEELVADVTMIGQTRLAASVAGAVAGAQLNARLYDLRPDGTQVLVDRGVHVLAGGESTVELDLHGAAWRFPAGHRIRLELAQDDDPYVRHADQEGSLEVGPVGLSLPTRELSPDAPDGAGPDVTLRVVPQPGGRFGITARSPTGERVAIARYEFQVGNGGDYQPLPGEDDDPRRTFQGIPGSVYAFTARAFDHRGIPGALAFSSATAR